MPRARATVDVGVLASDAEALWYDTRRWPAFVDGLAHVAKVEGDWPRGGRVVWDAPHGGRGRVVERVVAYEARGGQTVEVEDDKLRGARRGTFSPRASGGRGGPELTYELKQRPPVAAVVNVLSRRTERDRLLMTLVRFRRELETPPPL